MASVPGVAIETQLCSNDANVGAAVRPLTFASLEHSCVSMATPGAKACDAVGGALRPKWRKWPARGIGRGLSERVTFGMPLAALFALRLESCDSRCAVRSERCH